MSRPLCGDSVSGDTNWAEYARASRQALALLGYPIEPKCLPDEPEACGGTFAEHVAAHLAAIQAVIDHQWAHLGAPGHVADVYRSVQDELRHRDTGDGAS